MSTAAGDAAGHRQGQHTCRHDRAEHGSQLLPHHTHPSLSGSGSLADPIRSERSRCKPHAPQRGPGTPRKANASGSRPGWTTTACPLSSPARRSSTAPATVSAGMIATPLSRSASRIGSMIARLGEARADGVDADALLRQRRERAHEPDDRVLVGGVERVVRHAGEPGERGGGDDRAAAARAQRRQRGVDAEDDAVEVRRPSRAGSARGRSRRRGRSPWRRPALRWTRSSPPQALDGLARPPRGWPRGRRRRKRARSRPSPRPRPPASAMSAHATVAPSAASASARRPPEPARRARDQRDPALEPAHRVSASARSASPAIASPNVRQVRVVDRARERAPVVALHEDDDLPERERPVPARCRSIERPERSS